MPKLIKPSQNYNQQIREFRKEFLESGDSMDGSGGLRHYEDPADWIANLKDIEYLYIQHQTYIYNTKKTIIIYNLI